VRLERRLMASITKDTLLHNMRRYGCSEFLPPSTIGLDDWA
jgi:hypothetical protein